MLQLLPAHIIPRVQWEYDAENIRSVPAIWSHWLQFKLAIEANYQHGQVLTEVQILEIKARHVEVWQEEIDGPIPEEIPMTHFIKNGQIEFDSFLLEEV